MTKTRTTIAPTDCRGQLIAKITTEGGYFSITGEISTARERSRGDAQEGGCIHDRLLTAWPDLAPLVAIHLSQVEDGTPMHAESNGWYWLAGWKGGLGETYHGGNQQPDYNPEKCLAILADHVRLPVSMVESELGECKDRETFSAWVEKQKERWKREAKEALAMIEAMPEPSTYQTMIKEDDRTPEQKKTHRLGIVARDKFMSGWGGARGGVSRCAWACHPDVDCNKVEDWVRGLSEMRNVNKVDLNTYRPKNTAHFHIYVCDPGHPALD